MENTKFQNPHGLDDHENLYSTAYDMALLTKYAMKIKEYRTVSGTKVYKAETMDRVWKNKNKLLTGLYRYSTGGKQVTQKSRNGRSSRRPQKTVRISSRSP